MIGGEKLPITLHYNCNYLPTAPPMIFQPRSPINVLSGSWTELPCNVSGNPKPTVSWFLHDSPIDVSDPKYLILPSGNLRIFGVTPSDSGVYSCMASNPLGVARRPVKLSVQGKNSLKMIERQFSSDKLRTQGKTKEIVTVTCRFYKK